MPLLDLALLLLAPFAGLQSQTVEETLLIDISDTVPIGEPAAHASLRGVAVERLWAYASQTNVWTKIWTIDVAGGEPIPFPLDYPFEPLGAIVGFEGVTDLGNGRAVLAVTFANSDWRYLFGTDGTVAGTEPLSVSLQSDEPAYGDIGNQLTVIGNKAYFIGNFGYSVSLYETDGTDAGTIPLLQLSTEPFYSLKAYVGRLGNKLVYFYSIDSPIGSGSFSSIDVSGGTPEVLIEPISGFGTSFETLEVAGKLILPAETSSGEVELWITDGTSAGTSLLLDIGGPGSSGWPRMLASDGSTAWFSAVTPLEGRELWRTDGTTAGTQLVADIYPGPTKGVGSHNAVTVTNGLVFEAIVPGMGYELGVANATTLTTTMTDFNPGSLSSSPAPFYSIGGRAYFSANDGTGRQGYVADTNGTQLFSDIPNLWPGSSTGPNTLVQFDGAIHFVAEGFGHGVELWHEGPTPQSSVPLPEIGISTGTTNSLVDLMVNTGTQDFFRRTQYSKDSFYESDGTTLGTELVHDPDVEHIFPIAPLDGGLVLGQGHDENFEPWFMDGSAGGAFKLAEINPFFYGSLALPPVPGIQLGRHVYFAATNPEYGSELWRTDGTVDGTELFVDLAPGAESGVELDSLILRADDRIYFERFVLGNPRGELWSTDGTIAGTHAVAPQTFGTRVPTAVVTLGDELAVAFDTPDGLASELYLTDSTDSGTRLVSIYAGSTSQLTSFDDVIMSLARTAETGEYSAVASREGSPAITVVSTTDGSIQTILGVSDGAYINLRAPNYPDDGVWFTDGTVTGTRQLSGSGFDLTRVGSGNEVVFTRLDSLIGKELWLSDSTIDGTGLCVEVSSGPIDSDVLPLGIAGSHFVMHAFDFEYGYEPHVFPITSVGAFVSSPFGQGCGISARPDLEIAGEVRVGSSIRARASDCAPAAGFAVLASLEAMSVIDGDCAMYLDSFLFLLTALTDQQGEVDAGMFVGNDPALVGAQLFLQGAVGVAGGPLFGGLELTNGVRIVVGP